jgi:formamidopyrimidine-DNA glycosylase
VEGFRAVLARHALGQRVIRAEVADAGVLRGVTPSQLDEGLRGRCFTKAERHGKWLIARTGGPTVLLHFGMTGCLEWARGGSPRDRYDRVIFVTRGGELRFHDMRKLQGITLARSPQEEDRVLAGLGPDALDLTPRQTGRLLEGRRGAIKTTLTDQTVVAGLGNLLADEILWRAGIHPRRPARSLTPPERRRLHRHLRRVLRASVPAGRVPTRPAWLTGARGQGSPRCPRCHTPLSRDRLGGRTTVFCPTCQPDHGPLPHLPAGPRSFAPPASRTRTRDLDSRPGTRVAAGYDTASQTYQEDHRGSG